MAKRTVEEAVDILVKAIAEHHPLLLPRVPIEGHVRAIKSERHFQDDGKISRKLQKKLSHIENRYGPPALASYHRLALAVLVKEANNKLASLKLPEKIVALYRQWFDRMIDDLSVQPDEYYSLDRTALRQDLDVCCFRLVPIGGPWMVQKEAIRRHLLEGRADPADGGLPFPSGSTQKRRKHLEKSLRILLDKIGTRSFLTAVRTRLGSLATVYQVHTFDRFLPKFTAPEMERAYLRIAELMKREKNIKGVYRQSWFLDPALARISPELAYLREVPERSGAVVFEVGPMTDRPERAFVTSPTRRKLHLEGKYTPMLYAYVWPRNEVLAWAEKHAPRG